MAEPKQRDLRRFRFGVRGSGIAIHKNEVLHSYIHKARRIFELLPENGISDKEFIDEYSLETGEVEFFDGVQPHSAIETRNLPE
ncbi:MAG: hypothetical protein AAB353_11830 [Candidatus Hydrogenedentota bacterium]